MAELYSASTPAQIARPFAEDLSTLRMLDDNTVQKQEHEVLAQLDQIAFEAGMIAKWYLAVTGRALLVPATESKLEHHVPVEYFNEELIYFGKFCGFSTVRIENHIGERSLRAVCLTFNSATMLPYFEKTPDDRWLVTPVFAVDEMTRYSA